MPSHHEPLNALGPVEWAHVPQDDLKQFLSDVFSEAQTVIESIPSPTSATEAAAADDTAALARLKSPDAMATAQKLKGDWKEAKVNARDNPLGASVYKMGAKDGKGAWFARRSVHEGLAFDKWRLGLEREFRETMKVQGAPGSGNIRGIGAEKVVEHHVVPEVGQAEVYQLSAQFPGPTTPRDFITLLLTAETSLKPAGESRPLRQYVIVSKPCDHPECPPRDGIIRGRYESVEIVREIPSESAGSNPPQASGTGLDQSGNASETNEEPQPRAVEWLMVTRSDPGGSVPRFMIEKGTPPGIAGDADKFLKWVMARSSKELASDLKDDDPLKKNAIKSDVTAKSTPQPQSNPTKSITPNEPEEQEQEQEQEIIPSSSGLYGMITGAFGAASSIVASGLGRQANNDTGSLESSSENAEAPDDEESDSDTSSVSFTSALEKSVSEDKSIAGSSKSQAKTPQEKELRKLEERRRKLDEKMAKMQERAQSKQKGDSEKDAAALAKLREKHEREMAKQDAKYQRELKRLDEKQKHDQRKADERKRKAAEREEKANLSLELERTRAERDVALKKVQMLEGQVGDLQTQNTKLVAKLGDFGVELNRTDTTSSKSSSKGQKNGSDQASSAIPS